MRVRHEKKKIICQECGKTLVSPIEYHTFAHCKAWKAHRSKNLDQQDAESGSSGSSPPNDGKEGASQ